MTTPKTVYIDPKSIFPLPAKTRTNCHLCGEPVARWKRAPKREFQCSKCVLYKTPWSSNVAEDVQALIAETEKLVGSSFKRDAVGMLLEPFDADRVVVAIVMVSKLKEVSALQGPKA